MTKPIEKGCCEKCLHKETCPHCGTYCHGKSAFCTPSFCKNPQCECHTSSTLRVREITVQDQKEIIAGLGASSTPEWEKEFDEKLVDTDGCVEWEASYVKAFIRDLLTAQKAALKEGVEKRRQPSLENISNEGKASVAGYNAALDEILKLIDETV